MENSLTILDSMLIITYFTALILIGYITSKKQNSEDYLIAERKLGTLSTMATINASKTGSILMIFVGLVYLWGFSALWYFIGAGIGMTIFIPFAMKLKENSGEKYYTLGDYFKYNYGKIMGKIAGGFTIFLMFGFLVLNMIAGAKVFMFFSGYTFWICAIIVLGIVLIYTYLGGYDAVVKTDIIQYLAMIIIFIILTVTMFNSSIIPSSDWNLFKSDLPTMIGFFLIGILYPFAMPDLWQRVYSSKDKKVLKKSIILSIIIYISLALMLALIALTVKAKFPTIDPDLALVYSFNTLLSPGIVGLSIILLFAAIMSSLDTYLFTAASSVAQDFYILSKRKTVRMIKKFSIILGLIALIVSIIIQNLIIGSFIFISFTIVLSVSTIATWFNKKVLERTLIIGIITGITGVLIVLIKQLLENNLQPSIMIVSLVASIFGIIIGAIITRFKKH